MDFTNLMPVLIEAASFIAAFAAITAAIIMARFIRKFVTGILATGFKTIGLGIFILALGIIIDAVENRIQFIGNQPIIDFIMIVRQIFFVLGTYIVVIGSKKMGDKLETLSKRSST